MGRSVFSKLFSILLLRLTKWQQEPPPFTTYVEFLSNGPDRLGGVAQDHISARHLLSHASAILLSCGGNGLPAGHRKTERRVVGFFESDEAWHGPVHTYLACISWFGAGE